jgi:MtN3 and saliva related transmembrane protein
MNSIDALGYLAALLTSLAFLPQVLRVWRTRSARDVSLGMYAVFLGGVLCWLAYGILLAAWPVIVANAVTLALASAVLVLKLRFDRLPAGAPARDA